MDAWLEITLRIPLIAVIIIIPILVGIIILLFFIYLNRRRKKIQTAEETTRLRQENATLLEEKSTWITSRESYRQFLYNVSHDIANPLQSIQTNLDNMENLQPDEVGLWRQYRAVIAAEIRRLISLTDQLRLLARLETSESRIIREPVNIKGVIEAVMMAQVEKAEERNVHLRYSGPERLPRVLGDRDQLQQALTNLIDNGIKYSKDEGGELIINVVEENEHLFIRVVDDGIGISPDDISHVFETSYRSLDSLRYKRKGSGLGLTIVKRIVEQHGGEIRAESQPGIGTTISLTLPVYAAGN